MDARQGSWLQIAGDAASSKTHRKRADEYPEVLQAFALLAVAEAVEHLAQAVERARTA